MEIIYNENENESEVEHPPVEMTKKRSKSSIANWLFSKGIAKSPQKAEVFLIIGIFLIFLISAIVFSYGIGVNKIKDLEEGQTEYLEKT